MRLLRKLAETNNAIQSNEIFNLAEEQNISRRTLEKCKKGIGSQSEEDKQFLVLGIEQSKNRLRQQRNNAGYIEFADLGFVRLQNI